MTWNFYLDSTIFFYFCNYYIFEMRREKFSCFYLYFLIFFFLFTPVDGLRLTRHRPPSTVWGVQTQFFKPETEYFNSRGGTYHFRYDTGAGKNQIFRNEKRYSDNIVLGYFGYVDPEGILRVTEYLAGSFGFRQRTILRYPVLGDFN